MKVLIQSIHFDADQKLLEFINKKTEKLSTFYDHIIDVEIILRIEKDVNQENKMVEYKINVPGTTLFVKEHSKSFEAGVDTALEAAKTQLKKYKEKHAVHI